MEERVSVDVGGGNKKHTKPWVSTTTHPSPPPRLSTPSPKNLLHFYEKQGGLRGVRRVGRPTGTRETTFPKFNLKSKTP